MPIIIWNELPATYSLSRSVMLIRGGNSCTGPFMSLILLNKWLKHEESPYSKEIHKLKERSRLGTFKSSVLTDRLTYWEEICLMEWDPLNRWHATLFIDYPKQELNTWDNEIILLSKIFQDPLLSKEKFLQFCELFPFLYKIWNWSNEIVITYPTANKILLNIVFKWLAKRIML